MKMYRYATKILYSLVIVSGIGLVVFVFLAYFTRSYDPLAGIWLDGLNRPLRKAPLIASFIFGVDRQWPGIRWYAIDLFIFWGTVGINAGIFKIISILKEKGLNS